MWATPCMLLTSNGTKALVDIGSAHIVTYVGLFKIKPDMTHTQTFSAVKSMTLDMSQRYIYKAKNTPHKSQREPLLYQSNIWQPRTNPSS